jgi:SAM-dependent methyltransferase
MTDSLDDISRRTLAHYERTARQFFAGTIDHDVSQNVQALLDAIEAPPPWTLLDLGCGPGRDLKTFSTLGQRAIGLDGSGEFWHPDFLHLDLPPGLVDGVFANASLFHVPSAALPGVLAKLHATLKPGGVLFSSNPRGHNEEGWNGPRYGSYHDYPTWERYLVAAGFIPLHQYYRPPGLPREQQPWLASVWRKPVGNVNQRTETPENQA